MKIGLAQIHPQKGAIAENIELHQRAVQLAINNELDAIFFPELSITGYEPELAESLKMDLQSEQFDSFQMLSDTYSITIGIGVPTPTDKDVQISMLIFQPNQPRQQYTKQYLHEDELPYFTPGDKQLLLNLAQLKIAPAICYESLRKEHFDQALSIGAQLYLASVAKPQRGIDKAMTYFPNLAKAHSIPILMVNCIGYCDNFQSVGQSAIWDNTGTLKDQLSENEEAILVYDTAQNSSIKLPI